MEGASGIRRIYLGRLLDGLYMAAAFFAEYALLLHERFGFADIHAISCYDRRSMPVMKDGFVVSWMG